MTRDEYARKVAERLAELRRPTVAGDIEIPDALVETLAETLYEHDESSTHGGWYKPWADVDKNTHQDYMDRAHAGLVAVVPLIRAQVAAELRTCQETAASLLANDSHLHECEREAGHRSPRHRCPCGCEWWPLVEWERPFITPAAPSTSAAPVTYTATEGFYEPDEEPAGVQAAFDAGEKGVTRSPVHPDVDGGNRD